MARSRDFDRRACATATFVAFAFASTWSCTDACPAGYAPVQDQCIKKKPASPPHKCSTLPLTKDDPSGPGSFVRIDEPNAECFWMAQYEVTVDEYQRWVSAVPEAMIEWEADWCTLKVHRNEPVGNTADACTQSIPPLDNLPYDGRKPIRCVDFCDAEAFCRYAGNHLCYGIGNSGAQGPREVPREWLFGCTNTLTTVYPWGDDESDNDCNVNPESCVACHPFVVGRQQSCTSPRGVADLFGNVGEWTYACNFVESGQEGTPPTCVVRGGGFDQPLGDCYAEESLANDQRRKDVGFRCCADLTTEEARLIHDAPAEPMTAAAPTAM